MPGSGRCEMTFVFCTCRPGLSAKHGGSWCPTGSDLMTLTWGPITADRRPQQATSVGIALALYSHPLLALLPLLALSTLPPWNMATSASHRASTDV